MLKVTHRNHKTLFVKHFPVIRSRLSGEIPHQEKLIDCWFSRLKSFWNTPTTISAPPAFQSETRHTHTPLLQNKETHSLRTNTHLCTDLNKVSHTYLHKVTASAPSEVTQWGSLRGKFLSSVSFCLGRFRFLLKVTHSSKFDLSSPATLRLFALTSRIVTSPPLHVSTRPLPLTQQRPS